MSRPGVSRSRLGQWTWLALFMALPYLSALAAAETTHRVALTATEQAWLEQHPVIRIAPTPNYEPVEFFDAAGKYAGITAEYFRLIEQRLGYQFKVVRPTSEQWQKLEPDLRGADVITASAKSPARLQFWEYTQSYMDLPTYVLTRQTADDGLTPERLANARVAVVHTWAAEEYLRTTYPKLNLEPVADAATGMRKVSFGLVDAFVSELPVATAWMEAEGVSNLKISAEAGYTYHLSISVRRDWPELLGIMEKALATITPEERRQILGRWLILKTPEEREREKIWHRIGWGAAGVTLLLLATLGWNRLLTWRIRVRTQELRESEEKFSKAFRNSPLAVILTRQEDGLLSDANDAFLRMHGYRNRSEVVGRSPLELGLWVNPKEREELLEKLKTGKRILNSKHTFRRQNGELGTGLYSFERIEIAGVPSLLTLINDITEQERVSEALAASEAKFSLTFRSSPLAVAVTTVADGTVLDVNNAFLAMHGYKSSEEVIGRKSTDLGMWVNPEERAGLAEKLRTNQRMLNIKRSFRRVDGTVGMGLYSIELVEIGGQPCGLLLVNDITESERVQAALEQNELRLRLMAELVAGYSFAYLVQPDRTVQLEWLSQAGEKVLGFTEAELKNGVSFRERIHPDDRHALQSAIHAVLAGIPEVTEFRFRTKSGRMRWLQCFNRPEWSQTENRVVRILGAGQDITDRRTSQEALRDSIENTPNVCVQWLDEAGRITYWNKASQLTYGWSASEAMHKKLGQLMHTGEQETLFDQMIQDIKVTGQTFGPKEITFQRRDGRTGTSLVTLFAIPAPNDGKIYVRTDIDLTELKNAEADRERLLHELHLAEDAERRRIARELHDSTAQQLAVLKMNLSQLRKKFPDLSGELADSLTLTDQAIQEIRNFTWLLHPPLLDELGLARALSDYSAGFAKRTGIQTVADITNFSGRLPAATELALFRVAQESLNNIMRHSQSTTALIRLDRDEDEVRLEIQDTGHGMILGDTKPGVGMAGMRERLRLVGGSLDIESDPEGTTVLATVPFRAVTNDTQFLLRTHLQTKP